MVISNAFRPLKEFYFRTPIYDWRLKRSEFKEIVLSINDLWPGEAEVGREIIDGKIVGVSVMSPDAFWKISPIDPLSIESLHGFSWLRHLRAQGGDAARKTARTMVGRWLDFNSSWSPLYWRGDVLGERISAWIGMYDFFCDSADEVFRIKVLTSINHQAEHAISDFRSVPHGIKRIRALKGIIITTVALGGSSSRLQLLEEWLLKELILQINSDGGHISRSPAIQIEMVMALIDIRNSFRACEWNSSDELQQAIASMTAILRLWRHGDGKLALFHGTKEGGAALLESVIAQSESRRKTITNAPVTGFQRLVAGRSIVIVDTGDAKVLDSVAHSSPLSFEFSTGKHRLIVNCGTSPGDMALKNPLKSSVAHSMLTIDGKNASYIYPYSSKLKKESLTISTERKLDSGAILLNTSHNGYYLALGIFHHRRFYLASSGDDFRGEDQLIYTGQPGNIPSEAIIRFHLHPRVRASVIKNGSSVLLRPQTGNLWRFRTDGDVNLEESIYYGSASRQKSEQIVVTASLNSIREDGQVVVKWALRREE